MILDIHSHRNPPYPEGIISVSPQDFNPVEGQLYSVGIHPWDLDASPTPLLHLLEQAAISQQVVAIGECGIDNLKGGPLFRQLQAFKACVEISEKVEKPLILHCVKAFDVVLGLFNDFKPKQQWVIHGFRGKPELAKQISKKGIALSFGEFFNPDSLKAIPLPLIFAETDESKLSIEQIIENLSKCFGFDFTQIIEENTKNLLSY